jgi:hypothetical protein
VILDNGAANREPYPHAPALRGVESIKNSFHALSVKTNPRVLDRYPHLVGLFVLRSDEQLSRPPSNTAHGFGPVHDQIKHHLLKLHSIAQYRREISC